MGSPFPGMDPYIEACHLWEDFHANLIAEVQRALAAIVPDRYVVRAGERSYVALVHPDGIEDDRVMVPDVAVATARGNRRTRTTPTAATTATLPDEPGAVAMQAAIKREYRETFLEIRQIDPERKLVTGIEVLSPSNKRPGTKGWRLYNRKRRAFLSGFANFVEIDLLRGGRRMPMASAWPDCPYCILVCRKQHAPKCAAWPAYFNRPLPPLKVPLAPPDADVAVELQPLVDAIYSRSRYERDIDYSQPLRPALAPAEQTWLQKRLRQKHMP